MQKPQAVAHLFGGPLKSRRVRVAVATVVCAHAARAEQRASEEALVTTLSRGLAAVRRIAHEDPGRRIPPAPPRDETATTHP